MRKLKEQVKARILEALRGNDYRQGHESLRQRAYDNGYDPTQPDKGQTGWTYCCLGVICDLSIVDGVGHWDEEWPEVFVTHEDRPERETGVLPYAVARWAFEDDEGEPVSTDPPVYVEAVGGWKALSHLNDRRGNTFLEIADAIERDL